jgi:two-component system, NtrC family, sensor kinase
MTFAVLDVTIQPQFDEIERHEAQLNHNRVTDAFNTFTDKLKTATQDYAFWDETYSFIQGENTAEYISSNLEPELKAVENLDVNALIFLDAKNEMKWAAAYDLDTKERLGSLIEEIVRFGKEQPYSGNREEGAMRGLVRTSKGLALVGLAPIIKGERTGEEMGKVITAKMLNVEAAKQLTGVDFSLDVLPETLALNELPKELEFTTLSDTLQTKSVVKGLSGSAIAYLTVNSPRNVSRAGTTAIWSALTLMMLAGVVSLGVLWAYLKLAVVSPLSTLRTHFGTAGSSGKIKATEDASRDDEIGDLARSFNSMAEQVNNLRDALTDSAYLSGLSEWAAGTLHNVRNGLAPVTATTWQVKQLMDGAWLKNIEAAAKELDGGSCTPERREKLKAFIIGSAPRFVETAKKAADLTANINDASKAVLDIVGEFESYARRKTALEPVELVSLVEGAAKSTIGLQLQGAELILPVTPTLITGNEVILRQVISNIFINATEAIESQKRPGRIEITITPNKHYPALTRIAISDNGEGLEADRLETIFRRNVSTRNRATGGLGLHWCANAVKVMGGTIHAESAGPGLGATIVLDLPKFESKLNEAA